MSRKKQQPEDTVSFILAQKPLRMRLPGEIDLVKMYMERTGLDSQLAANLDLAQMKREPKLAQEYVDYAGYVPENERVLTYQQWRVGAVSGTIR